MIILGLTGSIGMGKSTTAELFRQAGVPVCDSDALVHELYRQEAVGPVEALFPGVAVDGHIDRARLSERLKENPAQFQALEQIIHPLVREKQDRFVAEHLRQGSAAVLLDIPLLFETKAEDRVDVIVVVTCPPALQRQRVLARPGMTEEKFALIVARQTPDAEKRKKADFVIDTGYGIEAAREQVTAVLAALKSRKDDGNDA